LREPSALRYASERVDDASEQDSGSGPPHGIAGWIRTGTAMSTSLTPGVGNCNAWINETAGSYGTQAELSFPWETHTPPGQQYMEPWLMTVGQCNSAQYVWCIEDIPTN